jgi:EpsI family protein
MKATSIAAVIAALMCAASVAGFAARPNARAVERGTAISLERDVPKAFGSWKELPNQAELVVNPQAKALLDKLYSQLLNRTYVNRDGYRIMLALAYGDDQRGGLQAHRPEVCYPAQGFKLNGLKDGMLATSFGDIEVRRLSTSLGSRHEPVTYWLTVGDQVIQSKFERRLAEIRVSLTGQIPDGLLFRVSSIDTDEARAYEMQRAFTEELMTAVSAEARRQLGGLRTAANAG